MCYIKKSKEVVEVKSLHLNTRKAIIGYSKSKTNYGNYSISFDDIELMQYTGLHDKNGKEIYEGDILKGTFYGFPIPEYDYVFQIYWDEKEKGFMANYFEPNECEVIGNIFENGDILNDSKNTEKN